MKADSVILASVVVAMLSVAPAHSANEKASVPTPKIQLIKPAPSLELAGVSLGQLFSIKECPSFDASEDAMAKLGIKPSSKSERFPQYRPDYDMPAAKKPCWEHPMRFDATKPLPKSGTILVIPVTDFPGVKDIRVTLFDGIAEEVTLRTYGERVQEKLFTSLAEKYGVPQIKDVVKTKNRMGAEFNKIVAQWKFTNLTVTFSGLTDTIDSGAVLAITPKAEQANELARQERSKAEPKL